ncbi:MAG: PA2779 family protein [Planctomycetota bacterium]
MVKKYLQCLGLFLASAAACALAIGYPHAALAVTGQPGLSDAEKMLDTEAGKTALAKAGLSAEQFKTMLASLSPEQHAKLEQMVRDITPGARLAAGMRAAGYTDSEVRERLALLSDEEIAKLADSPDAVAAGTSVTTVVLIILLVFVAIVVAWYFVAVEDPGAPPAAAPAE